MPKRTFRLITTAGFAAALFAAPLAAQEQKLEGIIVTHEPGVLMVKTPSGNQKVAVSPSARIRSISGAFNKNVVPETSLIPGLPIVAEGSAGPGGEFMATEIDYKAKDYKTAAQIQAGVEETARREAELRAAYSKLGQWDVKVEKNVFFKTGSAVISPEGKATLKETAREASKIKGYVISVLGYADPRGTAKANQALSNRRAQAVINYLKQSGHVLPGRVLAASAMGEEYLKAAEAADEKEHANSRRVTVRVVTSAAHLNP
jgi:outer membrane protein OmpA-like peptidoglycan-associated protein